MYKYTSIINWINSQISSGNLKSGNKLPTEKELMKQFSMSRQSVRRAISQLVEQGVLTSRQGSGTYVSDQVGRPNSNTVTLILTNYDDDIFPAKVSGIYEVLEDTRYVVNLFFTENSLNREDKILHAIKDNPCAGILIDGTRSALPRINGDLLRRIAEKTPCIMMDSVYADCSLPCVRMDDVAGGYLATKYLLDNGHRRIAYIGRIDYRQGQARYQGYGKALSDYHVEINDYHICWYTYQQLHYLFSGEHAKDLLEMCRDCTALFCYNDRLAFKFLQFFKKNGIRVPEDISIIGYDNVDIPECSRSITSINHPKEKLGKIAAENLLHLIQDPSFDANHLFSPVIVEGDTVLHRE